MSITATELKSNLGKYLLLAATEDIFITRNGKVVAKLSNPHQDRVDIAKSLFGILPADVTLEEAKGRKAEPDMRAVIDTCVIVDALQSREPFCKDAQSIFLLCANRQFEGFLTAKAITDIYYLTHRQTH